MDLPPDTIKRPRLSAPTRSWASGAPLSLPPIPQPVPPRPAAYQQYSSHSHESLPPPTQVSALDTPRPGQHHQHPDDHRHYENGHLTPMQELRHPPPSPAYGAPPNAFPGYPPVIKRDPADEHITAQIRPQSTGSGPESHLPYPPPTHAPPHHPSTAPPAASHTVYPEDPRRPMSFDAGPGPSLPGTPRGYRTSSYPPPGPVPPPHPYDPMYQNEHHNDDYYRGSYSSSKKKTTRASQVRPQRTGLYRRGVTGLAALTKI
ncbi:hypothetical protein IMZ48_12250 [Candidatus Bathyarchaeota archaeon]|nr:hypothetical protein [Candidatus Bathyarchaeota archaeon]